MRIVITRASSVFFIDGVNTFIFELGEALIKKKHDVCIVSGCGNNIHQDISVLFDVDFIPEIYVLKERSFKNWMDEIAYWLVHSKGLLEKLNSDVIIMNGVVPCFSSIAQIGVCHGLRTKGYYPPAQKLYNHLMYRRMDSIVAVSEPLRKEINNELGIKDVRVIPIGIEIRKHQPLPPEQRKKSILHVGTSNVKNLAATLSAFQMILSKIPEAELFIVGDNTDRYKKLIKKSTKNKIHFLGLLTRKDLMKLYPTVSVISAPSLYEAFPYTILEAFISGTPVVGSESIPKAFLVDGYNGYRITSPKDYEALGNRLLELLSNDSKWKCMSLNARKTALNFDILNVAEEYLNLIHEVLTA